MLSRLISGSCDQQNEQQKQQKCLGEEKVAGELLFDAAIRMRDGQYEQCVIAGSPDDPELRARIMKLSTQIVKRIKETKRFVLPHFVHPSFL